MAERTPGRGATASRALRVGLAGLGLGLVSGAEAGLVFAMAYHPHGGGQIGDWTALAVGIGALVAGPIAGAITGVAWGVADRAVKHLAIGLCALGPVAGLIAWAVAR